MSGRRLLRLVRRLPVLTLIGLVRVYQVVFSPLTPPTCRYYPSCSSYAVTALRRHGAVRGTWLAVRRVARCHPWAPGGVDDVPPARERSPRAHTHHSHVAQPTH
ncbi:membrane protein insertion efficiency factor YidD [Cellulomonas massiliensis]|uniref:membrane protein insertion efficiency factor YidD n=1 Tax=Cellulomonas massiliensis TaxID=1465811 RepID=UPI0002EA0CE5|nr:membrane protein insertion efficiency factor YidD [Cellulomonas massiliensis]